MLDDIKYKFAENFPNSVISVEDFRSSLRGLFQQDIAPLRPMAKLIIDEMEYSTSPAAQSKYAGTGVTITSEGTAVEEGDFSIKAVTDTTANRSFSRNLVMNLSGFDEILLWQRSDEPVDTFQFFLEDSDGNQSYWDILTPTAPDTWQQNTLNLSTPDGTSGTPADLSIIVKYGYRQLTALTIYYFDTIYARAGMGVAVLGSNVGSYYRHVTFQRQPLSIIGQGSPTISAPITLPRIDILTIDSSGTLAWVQGAEGTAPSAPWASVPNNVIPICEVYLKPTMDRVLEYDDKDTDTDQGYIYADVRPFLNLPFLKGQGANIASASTVTLGNDGIFFSITGTTTITSIATKPNGTWAILKFAGALTVTNGSNLKLESDYLTVANSILLLYCDGTDWHEISRKRATGKGADVASASTTTLGNDGVFFDITGTTTITNITIKPAGTIVTLQFDGVVTVTDGGNLKLNGNFVTATGAILMLQSDGTLWWELGRTQT